MSESQIEPASSGDDLESRRLGLEYARLAQEKELRQRELDLQERHAGKNQWSTPVVTAVSAGLVGLLGTVWNGCQNVELERRKQEGTLILEAIKTGSEQTRLAAANLLFLDKAGLIELEDAQRARLEREAGTNLIPTLPRPGESVSFDPSPALTPEIQGALQRTADSYQEYLVSLGFQPTGEKVRVYLDPELADNVFYDTQDDRLRVPPKFAGDADAVLDQFTLAVLVEVAGSWAAADDLALQSIMQGVADYLTCSFQDDPVLGEVFVAVLEKEQPGRFPKPYLRSMANQRKFSEAAANPYENAEVWGGAFWELRETLGKQGADQLVYTAWTLLRQTDARDEHGRFFLEKILAADQQLNRGRHAGTIRSIFQNRGLAIP